MKMCRAVRFLPAADFSVSEIEDETFRAIFRRPRAEVPSIPRARFAPRNLNEKRLHRKGPGRGNKRFVTTGMKTLAALHQVSFPRKSER